MIDKFMHLGSWLLTALSIYAAYLNVKKKRICFLLYTISNIGWIVINVYFEIYAQALLFLIFTGLSTYGWIEWGKTSDEGRI